MYLISKAIQKRVLSILSDRKTFLAVLGSTILLAISFLSFGEAWLQWSSDKYKALFNDFSNNLAGVSLQSQLCQYLPIDAVYTYVNGSDPLFQDSLKHIKEKLQLKRDKNDKDESNAHCEFKDCVPSHFFTTDGVLPLSTKAELIRSQNPFLAKEIIDVKDQNLLCDTGRHDESLDNFGRDNRTFLVMESVEAALKLTSTGIKEIGVGIESFSINQAYWTTQWTAPNAFPIPNHLIITKLPSTATQEKILHILPEPLADSVGRMHLYKSSHMAVVEILDHEIFKKYLKDHHTIALESGASVLIFPAYLIVSLPRYGNEEAFSHNRFSDKDELKYSLRSLEKYAPWIRHVYIVTHGQIPYWLNLDHPRLSIITHEEIFEDQSHLPTFSSPAIEANLFRIPGLSDKFLYLNDDVFIGQEIWPSDFYEAGSGQKVYFSWPLPDCAKNCPNSWIKDGYCDIACNTTECMHDGGDCVGNDIKMGYGAEDDNHYGDNSHDFNLMEDIQCNEGCLDPWLSDGFCDDGCNVAECGYDMGDCGFAKYPKLHQERPINSTLISGLQKVFNYTLPKGVNVAFWNLTTAFNVLNDVSLVPSTQKTIRSVSLSKQNHVLVLALKNTSLTKVNLTLQGRDKKTDNVVLFTLLVTADTLGHVPIIEPDYDEEIINLPQSVEKARNEDIEFDLSDVDEIKLNVNEETLINLGILEDQLRNDELTLKGFNVKKSALLQPYVRRYLMKGGRLKDLKDNTEVNEEADEYITDPTAIHRKLMDAYGDSMLHVNRLYTQEYGYANRLAIAHMPHMIDKNVFSRMRYSRKFKEQWTRTSSHHIRQSDDMQFAFSYFHYLINEKEVFNIHHVFHEFDTDKTQTWSDREIRTLLTRIHSLPLNLDDINTFERSIMECERNLTAHGIEIPPPPSPGSISNLYERYYDSKLPLVTEILILNCPSVVSFLNESLGDRPRFPHKIIDNGEQFASFRTITSNISQVVSVLDDLRKHPKKFFCLNDNTDPQEEHANNMVRAVLVDYLESVLPVPSSFELPMDYRNKFLRTSELNRWQFYRQLLTVITYFCIFMLIIIVIAGHFKIDIDAKMAAIFQSITSCLMSAPTAPLNLFVLGKNKDYSTV